MSRPSRPVRVALLAVPEVTASTLYGFHDFLLAVDRDWRMLHGDEPGVSPFRTEIQRIELPILLRNPNVTDIRYMPPPVRTQP